MNRINWKVRIKNPVFWVQAAIAVILPILTYFGLTWEDMTSWAAIGNLLLQAVKNPVVIAAVLASVWNAVNDPTTAGLKDSQRAMDYENPIGTVRPNEPKADSAVESMQCQRGIQNGGVYQSLGLYPLRC